jgi:UPF0042 nucleotide-binding protein
VREQDAINSGEWALRLGQDSAALRVLEDLGYYCVDNLPVNLLPQLIVSVESQYDKLAVSIDVRNLPPSQTSWKPAGPGAQRGAGGVLELLLRCGKRDPAQALRREPPAAPLSRNQLSLDEAIREETHLLAPLSSTADLRIDTTNLSIHDLSELIKTRVLGKKENELVLVFESFRFQVRHSQGCGLRVRRPFPAQSALDPGAQALHRQG